MTFECIDNLVSGFDLAGLEFLLTDKPLDGPLEVQSEIRSLYQDIERQQRMLDMARQDSNKYAVSIKRYETKIEANRARIAELESTSGGDGKPPKRPSGVPTRDEYQKEKTDLVRYFSKDAVSSVLKTNQDMTYAAIGLRLLNSIGKLLDNYEIHVPADYRLELLKRAGMFCEEANIFERLTQGKIQMFTYREQLEGGFIFRATPSDPSRVFVSGFKRDENNYPTTRHHIYKFKRGEGDSYISTSSTTEILENLHFASREKDGFGLTPESNKVKSHYLYIINPRALTGIDIVESKETYELPPPVGKESRPFKQKEVITPRSIDPRDIMGVYRVEATWITDDQGTKKVKINLVGYKQNEKYIASGWEINLGVK